ncbi:MAG: recombinase family protein [Defluviitaleaceae bacterium]|nr:recombinase family protein [Defluviitaleaceae bacterium]
MNSYAIYLRKSRADVDIENRGEGETLDRHKRTLLEFAKNMNLHISKIYKEVVSGETIVARPEMQQLLQDVEQGHWDGVIVMEIERLARGDTLDQGIVAQTFKYSDTKIITPAKTYQPNNEFDEEYFEFGLFMSRREYKTINRRQQAGRVASVKEGKYVGNTPPYGYERVKLESTKGYTLKEIPKEADTIRLIYELYTQGEQQPDGSFKRLGLSRICKKLNALNIKPKKAKQWRADSIHDILKNPVYNGKIRWKWRPVKKILKDGKPIESRTRKSLNDCIIADGLHTPIVTNEIWQLAQVYMKENQAHPAPSQYEVKNPLSGIIVCGVCGRNMQRKLHTKAGRVPTLICRYACGNVGSVFSYVEECIIHALEKWLADYQISYGADINSNNYNRDAVKKAIKNLDEQIKIATTQKSKLHDLLEQGIYSADEFMQRSRVLSERLTKAEHDKSILENEIALAETREQARKHILPRVEEILTIYHSTATIQIKNNLLKEVLERVVYTKTVSSKLSGDPYNFELELFPKLPRLV